MTCWPWRWTVARGRRLRATVHLRGQQIICCPQTQSTTVLLYPIFLNYVQWWTNRHQTKWSITQHKNVIHFFFKLPLMNHFSRQNIIAIAYKNNWFFGIQVPVLQATQPVLSTKVSQNDAYFRHAHWRFFRRSSNDCSIASRHSFGIFYAVLITFLVFLLSLSPRIIFISSLEAPATLCSASATIAAICKRSNVKSR